MEFCASDHPWSGKIISEQTDMDKDWGKRTVTSTLEIKRTILNVQPTDSRRIQAKIVPTIKLIGDQSAYKKDCMI